MELNQDERKALQNWFGYKGSATIDSVHNDEVMEILDTADNVTITGNTYDNMDM